MTVSFKLSNWCAELKASSLMSVRTRSFSRSCLRSSSTNSGQSSSVAPFPGYILWTNIQLKHFLSFKIRLLKDNMGITYADEDWLSLVFWLARDERVPFPPFRSGEDGAERSEWMPLASSTSDTDPFLFFFDLEKALLNELLNQPFFFLFPGDPHTGWAELEWLQADESEFKLETESAESCLDIVIPSPSVTVCLLVRFGDMFCMYAEVRPASTLCFLRSSIVCLNSSNSESWKEIKTKA